MHNQGFFNLLSDRRFLPFFMTQFMGAFCDNTFKSALAVLVTYDLALSGAFDSKIVVTMIGGMVILPFFLFSSIAGQIADKFEKSKTIIIIKGLEIAIMALGVYGFYAHSLSILMITLFFTMTHSAFFGPLKYSLPPVYLKEYEIIAGNGLIETSTFLAILIGSVIGGILISLPETGLPILSIILISASFTGFLSSLYLIKAPANDVKINLNPNLYRETISLIRFAAKDRVVFLSIIGISWFWVVGGVLLSQITTYGREVIGGNQYVATLFMILFAVGIGVGSFLCNRIMNGRIDARLIPWGAIGMTLFIIDLVIASYQVSLVTPEYIGIHQFLTHGNGWRITFDLLMIAICGGLYNVPLYAILQTQSDPHHRSRMIAANNVMNAFFMLLSSIVSILLISINISIINIFLIVACLNLFFMHRISQLVPESILQLFLQAILKILFRVEVKGMENYHAAGKRTLIIANHISFIDAALIFAFIPERLSYAIYTYYIHKWWIRLIASGVHLLPVNPTNPMATKRLIEILKKNRKCVIFPEGRITVTGALMKIYDGPGMIADKADATILPIRIDGVQYSLFSRLGGKVRRQLFPKVTITILPAQKLKADPALRSKERRRIISNQLYDIMVRMLFETSPYHGTLFQSLIDAAQRHGMGRIICEDVQRQPITYRQLIMRSFILGRVLTRQTLPDERVGILLPTSIAATASFFGLQSCGRIPAMLNFSMGAQNLLETCALSRVRLIITSRRFVTTARLDTTIEKLATAATILYLEDLRDQIPTSTKLFGLFASYFPNYAHRYWRKHIKSTDVAAILFTSGSEGFPKGVALSHQNFNANHYQLSSLVDFTPSDVVLNVLPMFHSFGLTGGSIVPILEGVRTFLYPSPLHYRVIPMIAYEIDVTIFFATDTFLGHYGRSGHPYDFYATRYVFAGAEKLRQETRRLWMDKFGLQIFEAYGTTEAAPAVTINSRLQNKVGTVGRFLPAIEYKLKPVEKIDHGGRLYIKGPNIMLGYLDRDTGQPIPTASDWGSGMIEEGWYDTGDIVSIDDHGFVTILGRAKRFAKIGGEMISLVAIEEKLSLKWADFHHIVLSFPDPRKGEQLVLLTTAKISRDDLTSHLKTCGLSELAVPKRIFEVEAVPLLPTGKTDFQGATELAKQLLESSGN
jgi:acyl-[acyl-carrier-protein]-phospholipid O-acyltransferase/long-chain-fatty-acid--[acyl-carrier-protein] ligase